jgi:hypothetical protein
MSLDRHLVRIDHKVLYLVAGDKGTEVDLTWVSICELSSLSCFW